MTPRRSLLAAAAVTWLLAGCVAAPAGDPPGASATSVPSAPSLALVGTTWQLVAMQSMDDAQGTVQPADPSRYTLTLGADGRAAFRLDCNRANASWQRTPAAADPRSGQLSFGPIASTRAMCPPDSLEPRLLRQLPYVRGYLLRDGQLHLSLYADGGILSWAQAK